MAYCDELVFRTSFPEEKTVTTVKFDCKTLLSAMSPDKGGDVELGDLLAEAITYESDPNGASAADHFFEVTLRGLTNAPPNLKDGKKIVDYLSETVPVEFNPDWKWRSAIEADFKSYFGAAQETIDVYVQYDGSSTQVLKPYGDSYEHARGTVALRDVVFYPGEDNLYWGWVGRLEEPVAVTDWRTKGLRVRVRNIQVDGTGMTSALPKSDPPVLSKTDPVCIGLCRYFPLTGHKAADRVTAYSDGLQCVFLLHGEQKPVVDRVKRQHRSLEIIGDDGALPQDRWVGGDLLVRIAKFHISPIRANKSGAHCSEFSLDSVFGPSGPDSVTGRAVSVILYVVLDRASKSFQNPWQCPYPSSWQMAF